MARKKKADLKPVKEVAEITLQPITETIEKNYMPYVMSVIISRALPDIDGFKPSHRKLLYTMYKMGLMTGARTKSANVVGKTMQLNPHGDAAIYETMVRLTRGCEALLHPFVDSKGNFGKQYSKDMAYAASRYTEVKLDSFCQELFSGIDKNAVDLIPNYDNTTTEPTLLPTTFPNILISPNLGIAVGMACSICSFNLAEVCDGTIALLKNPNLSTDKMLDLIKAPDFPGGGLLVYDREQMRRVYETVLKAQEMSQAAVAPGIKCSDVDKIARDYIDAQGYAGRFGHGLGHGVGIDIHEAPRLSMMCDELLQVGHVVTVEPGIYLPGVGGVRIENTCLVVEGGCKPLTTAPKDLLIL
jgi:DNA gyrase subunit A